MPTPRAVDTRIKFELDNSKGFYGKPHVPGHSRESRLTPGTPIAYAVQSVEMLFLIFYIYLYMAAPIFALLMRLLILS